MKRFLVHALPVSLFASVAACAPPAVSCAKAVAAPKQADAPWTDAAFNVEYKMSRGDAADTVLLAGTSDVDISEGALIARDAPGESAQRLHLRAWPASPGTIKVEVAWEERGPQHQTISWSSTVMVAEGSPSTAKIDLGGGELRKLTVSAKAIRKAKSASEGAVSALP